MDGTLITVLLWPWILCSVTFLFDPHGLGQVNRARSRDLSCLGSGSPRRAGLFLGQEGCEAVKAGFSFPLLSHQGGLTVF